MDAANYKLRVLVSLYFLLIWSVPFCNPQSSRFEEGDLKGFTRAHPEHMTVVLEDSIQVRSIRGTVAIMANDQPLSEVIFEIRDTSGKVVGTTANALGHFSIPLVAEGTYDFKATKDGFQSVVGKIVVSRKAPKRHKIEIRMPVGV